MARVIAFIPDLLFGSQVQGALRVAGHQVDLVADAAGLGDAATEADVLVVDLTDEVPERIGCFQRLADRGALADAGTLAFYSHVEADVRDQATNAGFDLVVPRSRMAREAATLITRVLEARP
jgi:hypothetical protein